MPASGCLRIYILLNISLLANCLPHAKKCKCHAIINTPWIAWTNDKFISYCLTAIFTNNECAFALHGFSASSASWQYLLSAHVEGEYWQTKKTCLFFCVFAELRKFGVHLITCIWLEQSWVYCFGITLAVYFANIAIFIKRRHSAIAVVAAACLQLVSCMPVQYAV